MTVEAAGDLYLWISAALDVPDAALLTGKFADLGHDCALALSPDICLPRMDALRSACRKDLPSARLPAVQREYARLFIGPPRAVMRPYASCFLAGDRLMADCVPAVLDFYAIAGIVFDGSVCRDAPDHIAVELNALAMICSGRTGQAPTERARMEQEFLAGHLGQWGPAFARRLLDESQEPLYCAAAELLDFVLGIRYRDG